MEKYFLQEILRLEYLIHHKKKVYRVPFHSVTFFVYYKLKRSHNDYFFNCDEMVFLNEQLECLLYLGGESM